MIKSPPWTLLTSLAAAPSLLLLWYWRTKHKDRDIQQKQADIELAQREERAKRFLEAVNLLSSDQEAAQIAAVHSIYGLGLHSEEEERRMFEILCAYVRHNKGTVGAKIAVAVLAKMATEGKGRVLQLEGSALGGLSLTNGTLARAVLARSRLHEAHLERFDLREANLHSAGLGAAHLRKANLSRTLLMDACLERADLREADISESDLRGAKLRGANLSGASLTGANLSGADFREANLTGADLRNAKIEEVSFLDADLTDAKVNQTSMQGSYYNESTTLPADLNPGEVGMFVADYAGRPV